MRTGQHCSGSRGCCNVVQRCTIVNLVRCLLYLWTSSGGVNHVLLHVAEGASVINKSTNNIIGTSNDYHYHVSDPSLKSSSQSDFKTNDNAETVRVQLQYKFFDDVDLSLQKPSLQQYQSLACQTEAFLLATLQDQLQSLLRVSLRVVEWTFDPFHDENDGMPLLELLFDVKAYYDDAFVYDMAVSTADVIYAIDNANFEDYIASYVWHVYPINKNDDTNLLHNINSITYEANVVQSGAADDAWLYDTAVQCPSWSHVTSTWHFGFANDDAPQIVPAQADAEALACQLQTYIAALISTNLYGATAQVSLDHLTWDFNTTAGSIADVDSYPWTIQVDLVAVVQHENGDTRWFHSHTLVQWLEETADLVDLIEDYLWNIEGTNVFTNIRRARVDSIVQDNNAAIIESADPGAMVAGIGTSDVWTSGACLVTPQEEEEEEPTNNNDNGAPTSSPLTDRTLAPAVELPQVNLPPTMTGSRTRPPVVTQEESTPATNENGHNSPTAAPADTMDPETGTIMNHNGITVNVPGNTNTDNDNNDENGNTIFSDEESSPSIAATTATPAPSSLEEQGSTSAPTIMSLDQEATIPNEDEKEQQVQQQEDLQPEDSDSNSNSEEFLGWCRMALFAADQDRNQQLNKEDYVALINTVGGNAYDGYPFEALPLALQTNFEEWASISGTGEIPLDPTTTTATTITRSDEPSASTLDQREAHLDAFCRATELALMDASAGGAAIPLRLDINTTFMAVNKAGLSTTEAFWENATDVSPSFVLFLEEYVVDALANVLQAATSGRRRSSLRGLQNLNTDDSAKNYQGWVLPQTADLWQVQGTRCPLQTPKNTSCFLATTTYKLFVLLSDDPEDPADHNNSIDAVEAAAHSVTEDGIADDALQAALDTINPNSVWFLLPWAEAMSQPPTQAPASTSPVTTGAPKTPAPGPASARDNTSEITVADGNGYEEAFGIKDEAFGDEDEAFVNGTIVVPKNQCGGDLGLKALQFMNTSCDSFVGRHVWTVVVIIFLLLVLCCLFLPVCLFGRCPCMCDKEQKPVKASLSRNSDPTAVEKIPEQIRQLRMRRSEQASSGRGKGGDVTPRNSARRMSLSSFGELPRRLSSGLSSFAGSELSDDFDDEKTAKEIEVPGFANKGKQKEIR